MEFIVDGKTVRIARSARNSISIIIADPKAKSSMQFYLSCAEAATLATGLKETAATAKK